ncbi:MAG: hypothetical protein HY906_12300 [Deltaproteobacteria bacterium]|nr:hypothetical protein [Deltaproteobacteria bacterium]
MTRRVILLLSFLVAAPSFNAWAQAAPTADVKAARAALAPDAEDDPEGRLVKKYPFRGSILEWGQGLNALALDRGAEQTYNPNYNWLFRLQPRYYVTKHLNFRLRIGLAIEWTNADDTTAYHQPLWEDIYFNTVYSNLVKIPVLGIEVSPSLRLDLPTSKASQARSRYLGIGPGFTMRREFKLPRGMELNLDYAFRYIKYLDKYSTLQYDAPTIVTCSGSEGQDCGRFLHSGGRNPSMQIGNIFGLEWAITKRWKFGGQLWIVNQFLYPLTPGSTTLAGGTTLEVPADPNFNVNMRASMIYLFSIDFEAHPAITVGLGTYTYNPQLREDGRYRAPFFNRYTELNLTTTINLDRVVAGIHRRVKPSAQ